MSANRFSLNFDNNGNILNNVIGNLTGAVTGSLVGNVTGNVIGNVTGNITGSTTGNVTGNLTGNVTGDLIGPQQDSVTDYSGAADAITILFGTATLSHSSAGAYTLAAPTAGTDDGKLLRVVAKTAHAHTVTQGSPGFNNQGGESLATFGGAYGDSMILEAINGFWVTLSLHNVVLS